MSDRRASVHWIELFHLLFLDQFGRKVDKRTMRSKVAVTCAFF